MQATGRDSGSQVAEVADAGPAEDGTKGEQGENSTCQHTEGCTTTYMSKPHGAANAVTTIPPDQTLSRGARSPRTFAAGGWDLGHQVAEIAGAASRKVHTHAHTTATTSHKHQPPTQPTQPIATTQHVYMATTANKTHTPLPCSLKFTTFGHPIVQAPLASTATTSTYQSHTPQQHRTDTPTNSTPTSTPPKPSLGTHSPSHPCLANTCILTACARGQPAWC